jgi:hypothetical protein
MNAEEFLKSKGCFPGGASYFSMVILLDEYASQNNKILRQAVADYMHSEGCGCCENIEAHIEHKKRLAELLQVELYDDNSGFDFMKYRTK